MIGATAIVAAAVAAVLVRVVAGVALAVVITRVSLRLLGIRRGWGTALLAGVVGWGIAVVVALGVNDWDWGADGLVLHLVAIGIPATMAAAVALDLLARPGSLAIGERAGLVVAPRPLRAVRRRVVRVPPLPRARPPRPPGGLRPVHVGRRSGPSARRRAPACGCGGCSRRPAASTSSSARSPPRASTCCRPTCARSWPRCRTRSRPSRGRTSPRCSRPSSGDVDAIFAEFEWEPLAAASIGQTHRARLRSGEAVVVKVQRPGHRRTMERDLAALALLADLAQRRTPFGRGLRSGEMLAQFAEGLRAELDFRREADAMTEMTARLDSSSPVRIPTVSTASCARAGSSSRSASRGAR